MKPLGKRGWITDGLGACALLIMYLPVLATLFLSFHETSDQGPSGWTLAPYIKALSQGDLRHALGISFGIALASGVMAVVIGVTGAFLVWRGPKVLRRMILGAMGVLLVIPDLVLGVGLLMWYRMLQVPTGSWMVVAAHVTASLALVVMTLSARLSMIDEELLEAASDLGARPVQILGHVVLPLLWPGVFGSFLLAFTYSFDDFILGFLLGGTGSESSTLSVTLFNMTRIHPRSEVFAWGMLMMLPLLFTFLSRLHSLRGVTGK